MSKMYAKEQDFQKDKDELILPDSVFAAIWNALEALLLLYIAFTAPYALAFGVLPNPAADASAYESQLNSRSLPTMTVIDIVVMIIGAVDVYLRAYWLSVEDEDGNAIVDMAVCRRIYLTSGEIYCDLASATPLPFLAFLNRITPRHGDYTPTLEHSCACA